MANVELGEEKNCFREGDIYGVTYESFLFVVSVFIFFVLCFFLFNGNAPLIYCFDFFFLKFSLMFKFYKKRLSYIPSRLLIISKRYC